MGLNRWVVLLCVALLLVVGGGALAWHLAHQRTADVHNGDSVPYLPPVSSQPAVTGGKPSKQDPFAGDPPWPLHGLSPTRTRDASAYRQIHPPYSMVWKRRQFGLLEYPPSFADGTL